MTLPAETQPTPNNIKHTFPGTFFSYSLPNWLTVKLYSPSPIVFSLFSYNNPNSKVAFLH